MGELTISSTSEGHYLITGCVGSLLKNKRAKMMLRNQLPFEETDQGITVSSSDTIEHVAKILKIIAGYIGAEVKYDDKVSSEIAEFKFQEEQFALFSQKAKLIKNDECDPDEFKEFIEVLHQNMPNRHLYTLQLLSAYHLAFSQNGCNFSVPGAGKTSIVYGAYTFLKAQNEGSPKFTNKLLIVGPLSSFGPWENEFEECFGKKPSCKRIGANMSLDERKQYFYRDDTAELNLISYQSLTSVVEEVKYFLTRNKVMVVLDEAHKIKNTAGGVQASAIGEIAQYCNARVVLTGTPAPNGYEDLYNLFHFIWPNNDVIRYNVGQLRDMSKTPNDSRVPKMMDNVNPYFVRIRKKDLHLPPPIDNKPIMVTMKDSQQRIYDYIEDRFIEEARRNDGLHSELIKAKMLRLQQVATNPAMLKEPLSNFSKQCGLDFSSVEAEDANIMSDIMQFYNENVPAKYEECCKLVKEIIGKGEKVIIWVIFIENIKRLQEYLLSQGIESRTLYGATPVAQEGMDDDQYALTRESIVKDFHKPDSSFKVVIANPFAVAESISLHKACHNAIYLERSFNCAHFVQSKDRIHRYGLDDNIVTNYYYILSKDTIDETIHTRLHQKEQRMLEIIESMPIPLFDHVITEDGGDSDIKAIITDYVKRKTLSATI